MVNIELYQYLSKKTCAPTILFIFGGRGYYERVKVIAPQPRDGWES